MAKVLKMVNGLPRMVTQCEDVILTAPNNSKYLLKVANTGELITDSAISDAYDETLVIGPGGVSTGTPVTLPNGGQYVDETSLQIELNTVALVYGTDWQLVGDCIRTQVQFTFNLIQNDSIRFIRI